MAQDYIETHEHKGFKIHLVADSDPQDPRDWCNLGVLGLFHKRYKLANETGLRTEDFSGWASMRAEIEKVAVPGSIQAVYMIDHSGIAFSTRDFADPWDSGQAGFIYTTPEKVAECGTPANLIKEALDAEVAVYSSFARGEAYGYVIEDRNGEEIDSCYGYFDAKDAFEQGTASAEHYAVTVDFKATLAVL
jgi:hypothetical protein